jgi:gamma-glutamylputrescine oxidase
MKKTIFPQDENFWYLQRPDIQPLRIDRETEIVVIGGGMAGLTAAQAFAQKGKKVILLEAYFCGGGASGKSSGFITPNGEIGLSEFVRRYGAEGGLAIWNLLEKRGMEHIRKNILDYTIECDYIPEDSLEVASTEKDLTTILKEAEYLERFGFETRFTKKEDIPLYLGTKRYFGGVTYGKNFGINAYKYCQAMKNVLIKQGVEIYEETPVLSLQDHLVTSLHATVKAENIIVCADRFIPSLGKLTKEIYHVQNFLLASQALTDEEIHKIFPQNKLMVWDTELIYNFYRITGNRLLLGGGSSWKVYNTNASYHSEFMYKKLTGYASDTFPDVKMQFEQLWPGLIGISKDIAPVVGQDKDIKSIYYIGAPAGLTVAAMLGNYSADHIIDGADTLKDYFSPYRTFKVGGLLQSILGTKISFAFSHLYPQKYMKKNK